jgi:arabinose-5-phosphate isomerase
MTANPSIVAPDARLQEALRLMEDRPSQISVLPVVDPASGVCVGLLRLHDIYRAGLGHLR